MSSLLSDFSDWWYGRREAFLDRYVADVQNTGPVYAAIPAEQIRANAASIMEGLRTIFQVGDTAPIAAFGSQLGFDRALAHVPIEAVMGAIDIFRGLLWQAIEEHDAQKPWSLTQIQYIEQGIHTFRNNVVRSYGETLRRAEAELAEREELVANQQHVIQNLSTPIVPVFEGVLVLPLIGTLDSRRASVITEAVLNQIVQRQADVLIMDMTGVPLVDSDVANHLLRMVQAVQLLGTQTVVVGIGAEMAQTIVSLALDLQQVTILANLQAAISYALRLKGFAITSVA